MEEFAARVGESPLALTLRLLVGLPLLLAGAGKLVRPHLSAAALVGFGLRRSRSDMAARGVGLIEVIAGLVAIVWLTVGLTVVPAVFLFGVFSILVARAVKRGEAFSCGCFGSREELVGAATLVRVSLLFSVGVLAGVAPVDAEMNGKYLAYGCLVSVAVLGAWVLSESRARTLFAWRRFVEEEIDWTFAAQLHARVADHRLGDS